jgi:hypothetical protein
MTMVGFLTDQLSISKILDHVGPRALVERAVLECGLLDHGYVVTQSVLSLRHADAVASDDHATAPPPPAAT